MSQGPLPSSSSTTRKRSAVAVGDDDDDDNPLVQPGDCRSLDEEASEGSSVDDMALGVAFNNWIDLTDKGICRVFFFRRQADGSTAMLVCGYPSAACRRRHAVKRSDPDWRGLARWRVRINVRDGVTDGRATPEDVLRLHRANGTGESAKSSNNAGNNVECNDDVDDDDDKSSDDIPVYYSDENETRYLHLFTSEFQSILEGMPREVIQRTLPEMYRDYLRCTASRYRYPWGSCFSHGFTKCFYNDLERWRSPPLQIDWENETIEFQGDHHGNLHLCLDNKHARLIHYMSIEDIKKFARICWRCPRLTSIFISYDMEYDRKMNYFFLEVVASSAHSRLKQLVSIWCCGCRMSTWLGSMVSFLQSSPTLTNVALFLHPSYGHSCTSREDQAIGTSSFRNCVDSNRALLEGVLQCKSLRALTLSLHGNEADVMLMVEAALIQCRDMQGHGLFKLKYNGFRNLVPETAFLLMRGALSGSVERLEISNFELEGSIIAQIAEAAQATPLESKLALKHLQIMNIQLGRTLDRAETSESMSRLLSNLPSLEYVAIDRRCLLPQSMPPAPAPFVYFRMNSQEFSSNSLDRFFELLPSSMIRALRVAAYFSIPDMLKRHPRSLQGLHELHISELKHRGPPPVSDLALISRLLNVLDHNTNLLKFSYNTYCQGVRLDNKLNLLCRRNVCIRMLRSFGNNKSADCLVPAALAYLGQVPRNVQFASSSLSSSSPVALTTSTANVSASAIFTYLQKQQLEI